MNIVENTEHGTGSITIGTKLIAAFGAMLVLVAVLAFLSQVTARNSRQRLDEVLERFNEKLSIAAAIELATTEMQGAQRGLMLSYGMNDAAAAPQYIRLYEDSGGKIDRLMATLEKMAADDSERAVLRKIRDLREAWRPRFQKLITLCEAGQIADAYKLRNENKVISANLHAAAAALANTQKQSLASARAVAEQENTLLMGVSAAIIAFALFISTAVLLLVRSTVRQLRSSVHNLRGGAEEVASAAGMVSTTSQLLAEGASEQAASAEETSACSAEISAGTAQTRSIRSLSRR